MKRALLGALAIVAVTATARMGQGAGPLIAGVASVIDGDTIEIHGQRIRLFGIDAPEKGQRCTTKAQEIWRCGQKASLALSDRLGRKTVTCEERDWDRYGRMVAICLLGKEDISAWMVHEGLAVAFRKYSTAYVGYENQAREARAGMWAGHFEWPWDWRKAH